MTATLERVRASAGFQPGARIAWTDPGGVDRTGTVVSTDDSGILARWDGGPQKKIAWDSNELRVTDPAETALAEVLSAEEANRFHELKGVVTHGLKTFVEVGEALLEIRELRLYRASHATFEEFCRDEWDFSRQRASQLIIAAEVVGQLSTIVDSEAVQGLGTIVPILPANEGQARALAAVPEEQRQEVWQESLETAPNGKVTAAHVGQTAARLAGVADATPEATGKIDQLDPPAAEDLVYQEVHAVVQEVFEASGLIDANGGIPAEHGPALLQTMTPVATEAAPQVDDSTSRRFGGKLTREQKVEQERFRQMQAEGEVQLTHGDHARHLVEIISELAEAPITADEFRKSLLVTDVAFTRQNLPRALATLQGIERAVA